jgi:hypothetical protein
MSYELALGLGVLTSSLKSTRTLYTSYPCCCNGMAARNQIYSFQPSSTRSAASVLSCYRTSRGRLQQYSQYLSGHGVGCAKPQDKQARPRTLPSTYSEACACSRTSFFQPSKLGVKAVQMAYSCRTNGCSQTRCTNLIEGNRGALSHAFSRDQFCHTVGPRNLNQKTKDRPHMKQGYGKLCPLG